MTSDQDHTSAIRRWLLVQAIAWIVLIPTVAAWVGSAGLRFGQFALWGIVALVSHVALLRVLGAGGTLADRVTLSRGALMLVCSGAAWGAGEIGWLIWSGLGVALLGDLADGWCARRYGATAAGAILDMETDQSATLCLAFLLHGVVGIGAWVYLLPGLRYGYILLLRSVGEHADDPKPCDGDNRRAKVICAVMMILLILAVSPVISPFGATLCAGISAGLLTCSYGSDVWFILRHRRAGSAQ